MESFSSSTPRFSQLTIRQDTTGIYPVFYAVIGSVAAGSVVQVNGLVGVTNPYDYNLFFGTFLSIGTSPVITPRITPAMGRNITPANHHDQICISATYRIAAAGTYGVSLCVYAANEVAIAGQSCPIDAGMISGFVI